MKIIVVEENTLYNNTGDCSLMIKEKPVVMLKADSALLKGNKPFFIPDFTQCCTAGLHFVVRISRLGKSIPRRFAYRYYDGIGVGLDLRAEDVLKQLRSEGWPWDEAVSFDGAAVLGEFLPVEADMTASYEERLLIDGEEQESRSMSDLRWQVDELIELLSQQMSLRQGDLLYCGASSKRFVLKENQHVRVELNGQTLLEFNIK